MCQGATGRDTNKVERCVLILTGAVASEELSIGGGREDLA